VTTVKKVVKNTAYRTAAQVIGNTSGILIAAILARFLGPHQFGIYSLTISIVLLLIAIANPGIIASSVRYISYYDGKNDITKLRSHYRYFIKIEFVLSILISTFLLVTSNYLAKIFHEPTLTNALVFGSLAVFFGAMVGILNSLFMGLQEFKYVFLKQTSYEFFRWLLVIPLSTAFLATGAIAGVAGAYFLTFILLTYIIFTKFKNYLFGETCRVSSRVNAFIGYMTLASISAIVFSYIDILMIGYLLNSTYVGYYRAACTIVFAIIGFLSIFDVLLPAFSQLSGENLATAVNLVSKYTTLIAFPTAAILLYLSKEIVLVIYGQKYTPSTEVLEILSLLLIPSAFNYVGIVFMSQELAEYPAILASIAMFLNAILNYILINVQGVVGAAVATFISRCFVAIASLYLLKRVFYISIDYNTIYKSVIGTSIMLACLFIMPTPKRLLTGLIETIVACTIYMIVMLAIRGITIDDINYIKKLFH